MGKRMEKYIRRLYDEGMCQENISIALDLPIDTVSKILAGGSFPAEPVQEAADRGGEAVQEPRVFKTSAERNQEIRRLAAEGWKNQALADRFSLSYASICYIKRGAKAMEKKEIRNQKILKLYGLGGSVSGLAEKYGLSKGTIYNILREAEGGHVYKKRGSKKDHLDYIRENRPVTASQLVKERGISYVYATALLREFDRSEENLALAVAYGNVDMVRREIGDVKTVPCALVIRLKNRQAVEEALSKGFVRFSAKQVVAEA